jgi:cation transport protein ChaC
MPAKIVPEAELSKGDLWVFGYGSLMWRPGFEFIEQVPARLIGEHRALCVYSFDHRGTPENPGLVLGLDRGGACRGVAFRVAAKQRSDTIDYLRSREQTTHVYREVMRSVWLEDEARQRVSALAYVVDRGHVQYAGRLSLTEQARYVRQGHGRSGNNRDYVLSTVKSIEAQGFRDPQLHQLAALLHEG